MATSFPGSLFFTPKAIEKRPWFRLVTCLPESGRLQINDVREGQLSVKFVSTECCKSGRVFVVNTLAIPIKIRVLAGTRETLGTRLGTMVDLIAGSALGVKIRGLSPLSVLKSKFTTIRVILIPFRVLSRKKKIRIGTDIVLF